jgi:hypothetical protein
MDASLRATTGRPRIREVNSPLAMRGAARLTHPVRREWQLTVLVTAATTLSPAPRAPAQARTRVPTGTPPSGSVGGGITSQLLELP